MQLKLFNSLQNGIIITATKDNSTDKEVAAMIILFTIASIIVFFKLMIFAFKTGWGITKVLAFLILLPLILIGMVCAGLVVFTFPILAIIGLITVIKKAVI